MATSAPLIEKAEVELRRRAEELLGETPAANLQLQYSPGADAAHLQHDLEVHRIELALQNEELLASRATIERVAARFTRLFDFAPVGYITLNQAGEITQVNLIGARLLGVERALLVGKRLAAFVTEAALPDFNSFLRCSFDPESQPVCELPTQVNGQLRTLRMDASVGEDGAECLVVITDVTERIQATLREQHRLQVLQLVAEHRPLKVILERIVLEIETRCPDTFCSVSLLDDSGKHLLHAAAPSLPDFFVQEIDGMSVSDSSGPCGAGAFSGKTVIVEDIQSHPECQPFRELARRAGLASCWSQPILKEGGAVLGTLATYHQQPRKPTSADITLIEYEADLAALAITENAAFTRMQMAASVFSHAREGIMITGVDGKIIEVNGTFTDITGYSRDEVIGQNPRMLQSGRQSAQYYAGMWTALKTSGNWYGELWNRRKTGEVYVEMQTISAVCDAAGNVQQYLAMFTDVTALKEHQQQLEHAAHFDLLTNLPNRLLLADRLHQSLLQCQRHGLMLAVLYVDLDGFKAINDGYGHDVGDELLISLAHRMKEALREGDTLARIGGDEFVAVLVDLASQADCEPVLNRLLQAACSTFAVGGVDLKVSASVGVTVYPQDGADADLLLRQADQAMYIAKDAGKNRYQFFDISSAQALQTQRVGLARIRTAIAQHELVLYYQPKVNLRTGAVVGAEALIRWQHPDKGLLLPGLFLPAIEGQAVSVELGEWVINTALSQMRDWRSMGLELPISVNVGADQLLHGDFFTSLAGSLAAHPEIHPGQLELEILETSALNDLAQISALMRKCLSLGVSFALDDFGTGYSSLTYLKSLPATVIKIDQSFVRDMLTDTDDLAIVQGIIGLATAFHRNVIAEGVETAVHCDKLLALGCELAQGYGIARPMPASDLVAWAKNWQAVQK